jgi:beta-glucanase (GH16 family)
MWARLQLSGRKRLLRWVMPLGFVGLVMPSAVLGASTTPRPSAGTLVPEGSIVDNFNGPAGSAPNDRIWMHQQGQGLWGNGELQNYTANDANAHLDGHGHLIISAIRSGSDSDPTYTSARLASIAAVGPVLHAEARIKMASGYGLWPTFWLMGGDPYGAGWPVLGEVDVAEMAAKEPHTLFATAHAFSTNPDAKPLGHWQSATHLLLNSPVASRYHIFAVDVTQNSIAWSIDHHVYKVLDRDQLPPNVVWSFNTPFHAILSLAVGGWFAGDPTSATKFPAEMKIDYVHINSYGVVQAD